MSAIWMTGPAVPAYHSPQRGLSGLLMLVPTAGCNNSKTALFGNMVGSRYPQTTIDSWSLLNLPQSGVLPSAYLPVPGWNSSFLFTPARFSHPKDEFNGKWFSIAILSSLCERFALPSVTSWTWFNACSLVSSHSYSRSIFPMVAIEQHEAFHQYHGSVKMKQRLSRSLDKYTLKPWERHAATPVWRLNSTSSPSNRHFVDLVFVM